MLAQYAVAFGLALAPGITSAQAPRATLPFITLDGQIGGTGHPERSGETFYRYKGLPLARIAVAVRLGSRAAFRPVAVLDYVGDWGKGDQVSDCRLAPNGTCKAYFPDLSGFSLGFGVRNTLGTVITVGVTGGFGRYKLDGNTTEILTGFHADAELALRFMKHAGVVFSVRHIETEKYKGARMWFSPLAFGIRLQ